MSEKSDQTALAWERWRVSIERWNEQPTVANMLERSQLRRDFYALFNEGEDQ